MSNLSAFPLIQERSEATPGLWNNVFSTLSSNIAAVDATVGLGRFQQLSVGSTPPSYATTAAVTIEVNSAYSDYLYLVDSAAQKSSYIIGSRAGGTADGLNIWDVSGATMIVSFSKQSVRFFQNIVGPVFDVGGALANTLNVATFGGSTKTTQIQAAISAATNSSPVVQRVYVPASFYPYDATAISFDTRVRMTREGGDDSAYDLQAYGAYPSGATNNMASLIPALQAARGAGGGTVYVPLGTYRIGSDTSYLTIDGNVGGDYKNVTIRGEPGSVFQASSSSGTYLLLIQNNTNFFLKSLIFSYSSQPKTRLDTGPKAIRVTGCTRFAVEDCEISGSPQYGLGLENTVGLEVRHCFVHDTMADGINANSCSKAVLVQNLVRQTGDDAIAISTPTTASVNSRGEESVIGENSIYNSNGRGIFVLGENISVVGNAVADTSGSGIIVARDTSNAEPGLRGRGIVIVGNAIRRPSTVLASTGPNNTSRTTMGVTVGAGIMVGSQNGVVFSTVTAAVQHQDITIMGNTVTDGSITAIMIQAAKGVSVIGNTIDNPSFTQSNTSSNFGIYLLQTDYAVVANNSFVSEPSTLSFAVYAVSGTSLLMRNNVSVTTHSVSNYTGVAWETNDGRMANYDGTAVLPSYGFSSERSLGWYRSANSTMALSYGTLNVPGIAGSSWTITSAGDGTFNSLGAPFISATGGGQFRSGDGVQVFPGYTFASDLSLGFYRSGTSVMALSYGGFGIKAGTNNSCGTAVLGSNGSVNVANTYVKTGDLIFLTDQTPGGTLGDLEVGGIRNSSGFTIQSTSVTDTSTVGWLIIRPG